MASSSNNSAGIPTPLAEGHSITRPPLFNGTHYSFWKTKMRNFVQSVDIEAWRVIQNGPYVIYRENDFFEKSPSEYTNEDWRKVSINAKAINIIYCGLDFNEYNRISGCESAKEIWDKLEITYEGTSQVKETKANILVRDYELFQMKEGETITEMSTRFTDLVNLLKTLGKTFEEQELIKKILRSLPKSWEAKITVIFDTRDFSKFRYDELIGFLIAHEMMFKKDLQEKESTKKEIALKIHEGKKKVATLNVETNDSSASSSDDEEMAMAATWNPSDSSTSDEDNDKETANICYMALEETDRNENDKIDLNSHIVKVFLTLKVENTGTAPASEVLLAFPPTQVDNLAVVKAQAATEKRKKQTYTILDVKPTELPDAPNGTKYFIISLLSPLNSGETATLEVLYMLTHSLEPFPAEISQSEPQLVYYHDSALILSPYHIKQQTTFIKTPIAQVESFTRVEPTSHVSHELKYGPYEDRVPYSFSPIMVHFENNNPFAVVEELVREVEISHWGNLQITEHYKLVHAGARLKGIFSRVDYQSRPFFTGVSSFKHLLARLPPRVHSVYYRDEIGNISSSHLRTDYRKSELEIEPRYPLFGGWKSTFALGYRLPLQDFLFESSDGKRYLNFSFGCPLAETVVDKLTVKVVLPEGSKEPFAVVPFPVEQRLETKYSYLYGVERTVLVLEKKNVVPEHNSPFQVYYTCNQIFVLAEPLVLVSAFFFLFVACVAYLHIDLSLHK